MDMETNVMRVARAPLFWSTGAVRRGSRFNAWRDMVSDTHLAWDLPSRRKSAFEARLEQQNFGAARIIYCECDPCSGSRTGLQISRTHDEYIGVLHVLQGREMIRQGGREAVLSPGDFCIWDSRQPIAFDIASDSGLRKLTILFPRSILPVCSPTFDDHIGQVISGASGSGALFAEHIRVLARQCGHIPEAHISSVTAATMDLLATAILPHPKTTKYVQGYENEYASCHGVKFDRARKYLAQHLTDPRLSPARIAEAVAVSTRQLHRMFAEAGVSVERTIWTERLKLCRDQLIQRAQEPVSSVAFRCGFNDAAHFSRAFRQHFGVSPREFRKNELDSE